MSQTEEAIRNNLTLAELREKYGRREFDESDPRPLISTHLLIQGKTLVPDDCTRAFGLKPTRVDARLLQTGRNLATGEPFYRKPFWVFGFENKFSDQFNITQDYATSLGTEAVQQIISLSENGSLVYAVPHPKDNSFALGFVGTTVQAAIPGLGRLLPHYGKYSYLGFEGDRPNNVLKGTFPALNSPLQVNILWDGKTIEPKVKPEAEKPLTQ